MSPVTSIALILSSLAPFVFGAPALDASSLEANGAQAQNLNLQFASLKKSDPCEGNDIACVQGSFAQCVSGSWETTECAGGTECFALPLVNGIGTSITCDLRADAEARISSTGATGGLTGSSSGSSFSADTNTNGSAANGTSDGTNPDPGSQASVTDGAASDCNGVSTAATTASDFGATASATLAPGFTLPPPSNDDASATANSSDALYTATGTLPLDTTDTGALPTDTTPITITLSPASASAFLSSLSAASPGISVSTLSDSAPASATITAAPTDNAVATSAGAISLSLFTTTLSGPLTESPAASLAAVPTTASYTYRARV